MRDLLEKAMTLALAVTAVTVAATAASQTLRTPLITGALETREPDFVKGWEHALSFATRMGGDESAPVKILELSDLQCPFCRTFHEVALELVSERPGDVQLLFVHHPLSYHQYALPAARAAECAMDHGARAFGRWVDAVYARQDSIGRRPWVKYAEEADLPDPGLIEQCMSEPQREDRINAGLRFGKEIGLEGTPTVIINGWRYFETPTLDELRTAVDSLSTSHGVN